MSSITHLAEAAEQRGRELPLRESDIRATLIDQLTATALIDADQLCAALPQYTKQQVFESLAAALNARVVVAEFDDTPGRNRVLYRRAKLKEIV